MDKTLVTAVGIGAVVILGGSALFFMRQQSAPATSGSKQTSNGMTNDSPSDSMTEGEEAEFSGSFMDLLQRGKNYSCTFESTDDTGNRTAGKMYVAAGGEKLNGQFTVTQANGTTMDGNVISDGEYNYIWTSVEDQGFKTKISPDEEALFGSDADTETTTGLSDSDKVNFDCDPWVVDDSMFIPPTDIEFVDFSGSMKQMEGNREAIKDSVNCSVCDQIPAGASRDQCLNSLGCWDTSTRLSPLINFPAPVPGLLL